MELTPSVFGSPAGSLATGFFAHASAFLSHSSANHRVCHISFSYPGKKSFDVQVAVFVTLSHFPFTSFHDAALSWTGSLALADGSP